MLQERGERVLEVSRPKRPAHRTGAKSDTLDAIRAARDALGQDRLATPRRRGDREALRVLLTTRRSATTARVAAIGQLKALIVGAPEELHAELRGRNTSSQIACCASLRERPTWALEHRATIRALRVTAQRIQFLQAEADQLQAELVDQAARRLGNTRVQQPSRGDDQDGARLGLVGGPGGRSRPR